MNIKKALGILGIAILGGLVALGVNRLFTSNDTPASFTQHETAKFTLAEKLADVPDVDFVSVAGVSTPAVVHIKSTMQSAPSRGQGQNPFEDFFGPDFRQQQRGPQQSTGSGVIINKSGYIVTNN
ncbi:MAG: hypothetical protein QMC70_08305, partial [Bacteroidia bacterium]